MRLLPSSQIQILAHYTWMLLVLVKKEHDQILISAEFLCLLARNLLYKLILKTEENREPVQKNQNLSSSKSKGHCSTHFILFA